jgi:hypothetical protein
MVKCGRIIELVANSDVTIRLIDLEVTGNTMRLIADVIEVPLLEHRLCK